jgi:hypothetical protein
MTRSFSARIARRLVFPPLAAAALCCLAGAPALARQCPSGQMYRVSKKTCVSKAEFYQRGRGATAGAAAGVAAGIAAPAGMTVIHSEAATAFASDDVQAPDAVKAVDAASKPMATAKRLPPPSPYGELDLNSFAKPR